jgi:hypothetical protein
MTPLITLVRSGRSYPVELGLLVGCLLAGVCGLFLGPFVPQATSRIGPSWLFYGLVTLGGVVGLGGICMAWALRTSRPRAALWGINLEFAAVAVVGGEWVAYALAIIGSSGVRGLPVAFLLAGIGGGCIGRARQITRDLRKARLQITARESARRSDGSST